MTDHDRPTSLQRAIDRALPIVEDRLRTYPGVPLEHVHALLLAARARPHTAPAPAELDGLLRLVIDSYAGFPDGELSEALDWVERAADAQRRARTSGMA